MFNLKEMLEHALFYLLKIVMLKSINKVLLTGKFWNVFWKV